MCVNCINCSLFAQKVLTSRLLNHSFIFYALFPWLWGIKYTGHCEPRTVLKIFMLPSSLHTIVMRKLNIGFNYRKDYQKISRYVCTQIIPKFRKKIKPVLSFHRPPSGILHMGSENI